MSRSRLRLVLVVFCALGALACESPRRRRPRQATSSGTRSTGAVAAKDGGSAAVRLPPGHVAFAFQGADLETQVLPTFQQQAGVTLLWKGEQRLLTLRLTQPTPWEDALDLVCQFTRTHATRDWQGRLVLKDGWYGRPTSETLNDLTGDGTRGAGSVTTGEADAQGAAGSGGAAPSPGARPNPTPFGSAYSGGAAADKILKGTNTTQAGGR